MKVGFTCGCYDGLHAGHRHALAEAARNCDYLIVAVNNDEWCLNHKGPGRPMFPLATRMEAIGTYLHHMPSHNRYDHAIIPFAGRDWELIRAIMPAIVFRGYDQYGIVEGLPIKMWRLDKLEGFSTTLEVQRGNP